MAGEFGSGPQPLQAPLEIFGGAASQSDLDMMVRVFSALANRPDLAPQQALSYLVDYIQTSNIQIAPSQITGQTLLLTPATAVGASQSTTSTSYVDLTTAGPSLTTLRSGYYVFFLGAVMSISTTASTAYASISVNGSTPADTDAIQTASVNAASHFAVTQQLLTQDTNTVTMKYRVSGGTGTFSVRQMIALRYANQ